MDNQVVVICKSTAATCTSSTWHNVCGIYDCRLHLGFASDACSSVSSVLAGLVAIHLCNGKLAPSLNFYSICRSLLQWLRLCIWLHARAGEPRCLGQFDLTQILSPLSMIYHRCCYIFLKSGIIEVASMSTKIHALRFDFKNSGVRFFIIPDGSR